MVTGEGDRAAENTESTESPLPVARRNESSSRETPDYGVKGASEVVPHDDKVRKKLAFWLLGVLTGTIIVGFALITTTRWTGLLIADVRGFFEIVFTAVLTLVSTVIGFYFGSELRKPKNRDED